MGNLGSKQDVQENIDEVKIPENQSKGYVPPNFTSYCAHENATFLNEEKDFPKYVCVRCNRISEKKKGYWNCPKCKNFICQSCQKKETYFESTCNNKHPLEFGDENNGKYTNGKFECDICGSAYELTIKRWYCSECNFDVCRYCKKHPPFAEMKCVKQQHKLILKNMKKRITCACCLREPYGAAWNCSICKHAFCVICKPITEALCDRKNSAFGLEQRGIKVNCDILGSVASIEIMLNYTNNTDSTIESTWVWPIDQVTSICGFSAIVNGVEREGKLMPLEKGKEKYGDAISSGNRSYLVKYSDKKKAIKTLIGNVNPGGEVQIKLKMVKLIELFKDQWTVFIPLKGTNVQIPVDFNANIKSNTVINKVSGNFKLVDPLLNLPSKTTAFSTKIQKLSEIMLQFQNGISNYPTVIFQKDPNNTEYAYQLSFVPDLGEGMIPGEHIFVLDKSGSMIGKPLELAKEACTMFLQSLPPNSFFNVYMFESSFSRLFDKSVEYTEANRQQAIDNLVSHSGCGGTNIYKPLKDIFGQALKIKGRPRYVYLLTDGEVDNKEDVISLIKENNAYNKICTIGIGKNVDRDLIVRAASEGKGQPYFIAEGEDMTSKIIRALEQCVKPALTDIKIKLPGNMKSVHQTSIMEISSGEQLCILGIVDKIEKGVIEFNAINLANGKQIKHDIEINENYENGTSLYGLTASMLLNERKNDDKTREKISLKYGVLCNNTSFFLQEKLAEPVKTALVKKEIIDLKSININDQSIKDTYERPPEPEKEFIGYRRECLAIKCCMDLPKSSIKCEVDELMDACMEECEAPMAPQCEFDDVKEKYVEQKLMELKSGSTDIEINKQKADKEELKYAPIIKTSNLKPQFTYKQVSLLQKIEGHWIIKDIAKLLNCGEEKIISSIPAEFTDPNKEPKKQEIWATLLAVSIFKLKFASEQSCWKLVNAKAMNWLSKFGINENSKEIKDAEKFIESI